MNIEQVIAKINKCRALSNSTNEAEATSAAAFAAALMRKYEIEEAQLVEHIAPEEPIDPQHIIAKHTRKEVWRGDVAGGVAESLGCKFYWNRQWEKPENPTDSWKKVVNMRMIGRASDARAAAYLYSLICEDINRIAKKALRQAGIEARERGDIWNPRSWLDSFRRGCAIRVRERLTQDRKKDYTDLQARAQADPGAARALIVIDRKSDGVRNAAAQLKLRYYAARAARSYNGYHAGRSAGDSVNLGGRATAAIGSGMARVSA